MSYSFDIHAATVADAEQQISGKLAEIVGEQPDLETNCSTASIAAGATLATVGEPGEGMMLAINIFGGVLKSGEAVTQASVSIRIDVIAADAPLGEAV